MTVSYQFYRDDYLGSAIPESAFLEAMCRAAEFLQYLKSRYRVVSSGEESEKLALCAMAETAYQAKNRIGITSASAGSVRVQYRGDTEKELRRRLMRSAAIYLDIYRGVSQ